MKSIFKKLKAILHNLLYFETIIKKEFAEKLLIFQYNQLATLSRDSGTIEKKHSDPLLVISLTTYGDRIYDVYLTIESLMQQTLKPNKIVLWLSKTEFNNDNIPYILKNYVKRGLTIGYCEDLKSYKKLIPTIVTFPNSLIITVDDDVIYSRDLVENFYKSYLTDTSCIYFNRAHKMTFDKKGKLMPYLQWEWETSSLEKSLLLVPTGNGGIFYPPNCFHSDVTRDDIFMELCPTTDDIWFKSMSLKKGTGCRRSLGNTKYYELPDIGETGLNKVNNRSVNINDRSVTILFNKYNLDFITNKLHE